MANEPTLPLFAKYIVSDPPEFIYHYTDQSGLLGIFESLHLRATHSRYMNDATEFHLQLDLLKSCLTNEANKSVQKDPLRQRLAIGLHRSLSLLLPIYSFVACFCSEPDTLGQWRGYSGNRYGYSIGFRSSRIKALLDSHEHGHMAMGKCIYERSIQLRIVRELVDHFLNGDYHDWEAGDLLTVVLGELFRVGLFFKDAAFEQEQEWRIILFEPEGRSVKFRPGISAIIPYVNIPIGKGVSSAIDHIYVGPCPNMDISTTAVHMLMRKHELWRKTEHGGLTIDVRQSTVPFRNW